jgi:hypothetical protein
VAHVDALTIHLLPNDGGNGWEALGQLAEELATGDTIRATVEENGARLFV